jgi:hypothetical protein
METLRQEFAKSEAIRRRIMRRVWYAFTLSIVLRPALALGFLFGGSIIAFWKLVSISSIIENFLNVQVGQTPAFVFGALSQTEIVTAAVFSVILVVGLMMSVQVVSLLRQTLTPTASWQRV